MTAIADRVAADASADAAVPDKAPREGRLYALDVLRFCAAALVLAFHLIPIAAYALGVNADQYFSHPVAQFSRYGWMGVELFFLISGFVICMSSWGRSLGQFFTSRVTRLLPAYLLAVAITATLQTVYPTPDATRPSLSQVLANLTMVQGLLGVPSLDFVYWSLLVELKFYFLFAVVVWAGVTYRRTVVFCVAWMTAALVAQAADVKVLTVLVEPQYAPYFIAGITLYLIHRFGPNLLLWGMLGASFLFCTASLAQTVGSITTWSISYTKALLLLAAFFAVMVATALGWLSRLRWRGLAVLGALTYPVYLLHFYVGFAAMRLLRGTMPGWLLLPAVVLTILGLGYLVHWLVEGPLSGALRRGLRASFADIRR